MNIQEGLELINYNIQEGWNHLWNIMPGNPIRGIDFADNNEDPIGTLFVDNKGEVLSIQVSFPNGQEGCYRWSEKSFSDNLNKEAKNRNIDPDIAWDNVKFTDIISESEMKYIVFNLVRCQSIENSTLHKNPSSNNEDPQLIKEEDLDKFLVDFDNMTPEQQEEFIYMSKVADFGSQSTKINQNFEEVLTIPLSETLYRKLAVICANENANIQQLVNCVLENYAINYKK